MVITRSKKEMGFQRYCQFIKDIDSNLNHDKKHREFIVRMLRYVSLNGNASTWQFGLNCFKNLPLRTGDMMARRILEGRKDNKKKKSPGIIELGLLSYQSKEGKIRRKNYQLTLYGLLYSIKNCKFTSKEMYQIARVNESLIPLIFKKSWYLEKKKIGLEPLKLISSGRLENNTSFINQLPYYEIMNFLLLFRNDHEKTKEDLSTFISFWFYTYLMWSLSKNKNKVSESWKNFFWDNSDLRSWYSGLLLQVRQFYHLRSQIIEKELRDVYDETSRPGSNKILKEYLSNT